MRDDEIELAVAAELLCHFEHGCAVTRAETRIDDQKRTLAHDESDIRHQRHAVVRNDVDVRRYLPQTLDFHERIGRWPDAPKGRTRREIIALRRGLPVFRGSGTAKLGLSEADSLQQAEALPPPVYDADRRLRELDEMERRA